MRCATVSGEGYRGREDPGLLHDLFHEAVGQKIRWAFRRQCRRLRGGGEYAKSGRVGALMGVRLVFRPVRWVMRTPTSVPLSVGERALLH